MMHDSRSVKESIALKQAEWIAAISYDDLPQEVVARAKQCLLDFLGVAIRGSTLDQVQPVRALLSALGSRPVASVIGGEKAALPYAAFANATFGHSCEFDDSHFHCGHPGVCVIPAALAVAEAEGADGKQLITAIVAGYQAMVWSVGPIHRRTLDLGWHGTKVGGVFGAAAATGKLIGLSGIELANALAVAASDASGTMEYDQSGGEVKRFHAGSASRSGVQAAILAKAGLTGPLTIFEGMRGIYRLFSAGAPAAVDRYWDGSFHILETMFKLYPCAGTIHAALDCIRMIQDEGEIPLESIESIEVGLADWAVPHGAAIVHPTDAISAQFSLAFGIALRLARRDNAMADYLDAGSWNDPLISGLCEKVRPVSMPIPADAAELCARVRVRLDDGRVLEAFQAAPRGYPTNPASVDDIRSKFRSVTAGLVSAARADAIIGRIDSLEQHDGPGLVAEILRGT